jgi:DNA replication licensing factor MCM5
MREFDKTEEESPDFQVLLFSNENTLQLRHLKSKLVNNLVTVSGIIVNSTRVSSKLKKACIQCRSCKTIKMVEIGSGLSGLSMPRYCESNKQQNNYNEKCAMDPYVIVPDKSIVVDQQTLRLQETPENVPSGEIPRAFQLSVERTITSKLIAGTRVTLTGVYML